MMGGMDKGAKRACPCKIKTLAKTRTSWRLSMPPRYTYHFKLDKALAQAAGVTVLDSTAGTLSCTFYIALCGAPGGDFNFVKIPATDLPKLSNEWSQVNESLIVPGMGCGGGLCPSWDPWCGPILLP